MAKSNSLSPNANSLLRSIFNCCKAELGRLIRIFNDGVASTIGVDSTFQGVAIKDIVSNAGFLPDKPQTSLETFHAALSELCNKKCIIIEGQNLRNRIRSKAPLQIFSKAAMEFGANCGTEIDPHLDTKFCDYIGENYPQLASTKIYITEGGAHWCTDKRYGKLTPSLLPPPPGNIA